LVIEVTPDRFTVNHLGQSVTDRFNRLAGDGRPDQHIQHRFRRACVADRLQVEVIFEPLDGSGSGGFIR
jgi:hypothetical protein